MFLCCGKCIVLRIYGNIIRGLHRLVLQQDNDCWVLCSTFIVNFKLLMPNEGFKITTSTHHSTTQWAKDQINRNQGLKKIVWGVLFSCQSGFGPGGNALADDDCCWSILKYKLHF